MRIIILTMEKDTMHVSESGNSEMECSSNGVYLANRKRWK